MLRKLILLTLIIFSNTAFAAHKCSEKELAVMKDKATRGDIVEQHNMGIHYYNGFDAFVKDRKKALEWFEKSGIRGYVPSMKMAFKAYYYEKDYTNCMKWCNKVLAVNKYDADAYRWLYQCDKALGRENSPQALNNLKLAAEYGNIDAINSYACYLYNNKQYEEAYRIWCSGLFHDNSPAVLGAALKATYNNIIYCCLIPGTGCEKDYIAAAKLFAFRFYGEEKEYNEHATTWQKIKTAADAGDPKACYAQYVLLQAMNKSEEAGKYLTKAQKANVPDALWDKEYEKFENNIENTDQLYDDKYVEEVKKLFNLSIKNNWISPLIYWALEDHSAKGALSEVASCIANYLEENGNKPFVEQSRLTYLAFLYIAWIRDYCDNYYDFLATDRDKNVDKKVKLSWQKYYIENTERIYDSGLRSSSPFLATLYYDKDIAEYDKAFKYASIASNYYSEIGNPLGLLYYEGKGTQKNLTTALSYLIDESYDKESLLTLSKLYRFGQGGVLKDIDIADKYLKASLEDDKDAAKELLRKFGIK